MRDNSKDNKIGEKQDMLNFVDLFAGPGGLSLGFDLTRDRKGEKVFNLLKAVERDPCACQTLRRNFKDESIAEGDLSSKVVREQLENECGGKTDVVLAGPPCQSYSTIGPRAGNSDNSKEKDRYDLLYKYFVDVVRRLMPDFVVFENVKGMLSKRNGKTRIIDMILRDLTDLGYTFENDHGVFKDGFVVLNAADFGVPQTRERVFLIGNRLGIPNPYPAPTHYDPETFPLNRFLDNGLLPYVTVFDAVGDLPKLRAKKTLTRIAAYRRREVERYNGRVSTGEEELEYGLERLEEHREKLGPSGRNFLAFVRNGADAKLTHHVARPQQESDIKLFAGMKPGTNAKDVVNSRNKRMRKLARLIRYDMESFKDKYKKQAWDRPCSTIFAHMKKDGNRFIHPDGRQARTFTPREAARIQSFPDSFFFEGSRSKKFEQIGNAVPPLLAKAIAESIHRAMVDAHRG